MNLWSSTDTIIPRGIITKAIEYQEESTKLAGYLAYDNSKSEKRPGVLIIHEWWGLNEYAKMRAQQLSAMGYCAFALDMYGNGKNTENQQEAMQLAGALRSNRSLMRKRARAGLDALLAQDMVDRNRVAVIGFCFGGSAALELAYSGAPVRAVVSFHAKPVIPEEDDLLELQAGVLFLHGADDPSISPQDLSEFMAAMRKSRTDWQMVYYGNTVHAFTNPMVDKYGIEGLAYNPTAAQRAWIAMQIYLKEIFGISG
jgi:dienelactone hydrolase